MIAFLRRHRPRNRLLGALYWLALSVLFVAAVFTLFYVFEVDRLLPGGGMF